MMKDDISHEEYRSKLANVADLAVSYINTGNGYFRMRDAFNGLAEQCGANKGINDEATVGRRKLLTSSLKKHAFYNLLINNILHLCVT